MSLARTRCVALLGVDGALVDVEADAGQGLPHFSISGLPDAACAQSPDRIKAAASNSNVPIPSRRLTVNLSPASMPKSGSGFDLAIAVAVLGATGQLPPAYIDTVMHLGELSLDGSVRAIPGVLPAVVAAVRDGHPDVVVPAANAYEASLVPGARVVGVRHLGELVARYVALAAGEEPPDPPAVVPSAEADERVPDLADVLGQDEARLALEVAAAGRHHLCLVGPPGAGKTMLAERLPGLLPVLDRAQALEVSAIHSVLGALPKGGSLVRRPPFVAPHHGASMPAIVGGGSGRVRPGAVSRAHHGVLFLDEAPEFRSDVLDALRAPIESGTVVVARASSVTWLPARFQLVLASNPCPCGQAYGKGTACSCSPMARRRYLARLSGPLLDRVDLQVQVAPVARHQVAMAAGESTAVVSARVLAARVRQRARLAGTPWTLNAEVPGAVLRRAPLRLPSSVAGALDRAIERGVLTLRGYDRVLRLAWTMADLADHERPGRDDIGLALALRGVPAAAA